MGAAAADVNNDGCVDLFVTASGGTICSATAATVTFTDIWKAAPPDRAVSASFLDYDRDGWLDLYVGNYVDYRLATTTSMPNAPSGAGLLSRRRHFGAPTRPSVPEPGEWNVRRRDGARLVREHRGPALGVSTADFNSDGWIDIYVANDGEAEPVVDEPAGRDVQGHGARRRRRAERRGSRGREHGRRRGRLRQRRRRRPVHDPPPR